MRSVNKVIIIGNLTRDPVMKMTQSGQPVATFGVATNRQWITRDNNRHDSTEFHEVVAWAKLADICDKYLRKGMLVYVEGYLKTRSWEMPDGQGKKFRTEVVVQDIIILEKRSSRDDHGEGPGGEYNEPADMVPQASPDEPPIDELDLGEAISEEGVQ